MPDEQIYIVDENDKVIKIKRRDELTDQDRWRIVSIWITNPEGNKILLQKRKSDKRIMPGAWTAAVEGTVSYGDTYESTAYKELFEEIGLRGVQLTPGKKYCGRWGNLGSRQAQSYKAVFEGEIKDLVLQADEVAEVKWFSAAEIAALHRNHPEKIPLYHIYEYFEFI